MSAPVLTAALGDYAHTRPIKTGALRDPRVDFDWVEVDPIHDAFAPMVRRQAYDLSELAIVTALQAVDFQRPVILLPVVLSARFQRACLIGYRPRGLIEPQALAGRIVGVRAFTQTTGMWVRAALRADHGVQTSDVRWRTREPAHVEEYRDPPFVEHEMSSLSLPDQLRKGEIDAAIMGNDRPDDPDFAPLIADHLEADRAFYARFGFMPVNHMACVSIAAVERAPDAVCGAFALLRRAIEGAPASEPQAVRIGLDALREPVSMVIDEALHQGLIRRRLSVDEVFGPAEDLLKEAIG